MEQPIAREPEKANSLPLRPRTTAAGCPRCNGDVFMRDEPTCWDCGWRDFDYKPPGALESALGSARRFRVRYSGVGRAMQGIVIDVAIVARGPTGPRRAGRPSTNHSKADYQLQCPFCGADMEFEQGSNERIKDVNQTRYQCPLRHSIKLNDPLQGAITWS